MLVSIFTKLYDLSKVVKFSKHLSSFAQQMSEALAEKETNAAEKTNNESKSTNNYKSRYSGNMKRRHWVDYETGPEAEAKRASVETLDRIKRRKCCLLLGYSGVNYFGMQRNPERKTIEEDLLTAMLKNKWITDEHFKQAQIIQFQRAARTDKGVSAARQCVSLKLPDDIDVSALNSTLPDQIRVFAVKRVTKGFNSKDQCNARTYTYTLPTIAFANQTDQVDMETYRVPEEKLKEFNSILKQFEGTKNFHNFTSRKDFSDPSAKRFIMSFDCDKPFVKDGLELCVIKIKGQSFMLHQIRKMIGLSLAIVRGLTSVATLETALTEERIDIPMAPGLGLVLDTVHYDRYNQRYGSDGIHEPLDWKKEEGDVKEFFDKFIITNIIDKELKEKSMVSWLETLPIHSYDVRPEDRNKDEDQSALDNEE